MAPAHLRAFRGPRIATVVAVGVALLSGCSLLPWYGVPDDTFARDTVRVACCARGDTPVELTYLGVGGWIVRAGGAAVLTAPFYSNPGVLETGLTPIRAEPEAIDRHLPDVSDVSAVLVGHGHYDHLMDVPWILENRAPDALLLASETSWRQVEPYGFGRRALEPVEDGEVVRPAPGGEGRVVVLDEGLAGTDTAAGRWIEVADGVRVMPLLSDHAPHVADVVLYSGERRTRMSRAPVSAEEWLDGQTYAFLIDLHGPGGERLIRIYYQDAVAAAPYGLVPPGLEDSVDVAIVAPATYAGVDWHPEALLGDAPPGHVLLGHWEDFFQSPSEPADPVTFTLLPDFLRRLERALPEGAGYHVPVPGTVIVFR